MNKGFSPTEQVVIREIFFWEKTSSKEGEVCWPKQFFYLQDCDSNLGNLVELSNIFYFILHFSLRAIFLKISKEVSGDDFLQEMNAFTLPCI